VLEFTPIAVIMAAPDGTITYVNQRLEDLFGVRRQEVWGRPVNSLYAEPTDRDQVAEIVARDGQLRNHDVFFRTKAGLELPVLLSAQSAPGEDGAIIGWAIDISKRKRIEQDLVDSHRRFQDFADVSVDWLWQQDADLRFTYASATNEDDVRLDFSHLIGKTRREVDHGEITEHQREVHDSALARREPRVDWRGRHIANDGQVKFVSIRGRP
jgi:PAS domain S-box-containing protein